MADPTAVLEELARSIAADEGPLQLELWTPPEREQRARDTANLRARLAQIPDEIEREAAHIRARYEGPTPRLFPVAVSFLVPVRSA